jgi:hypothetical protein
MDVRRLAGALATLVISAAAMVAAGPLAGAEGHVAGWTNGCFGAGCTPSTQSSLQVTPHLGLMYVNGTFAASTAQDSLTLGGSPSIPNTDNLGSLMLGALAASYEGETFDLRVRMSGASVSVPATLHGAVTDAGAGGVVFDFDDAPHGLNLSDGTPVNVTVHDVALAPGATVALGATITTGAAVAPVGAVVATPAAGATPIAVVGTGIAGTTAGGVLPLSLGTVSVGTDPADHAGETVRAVVDLTAPVAAHAAFVGTVRGTVVAAATGAYVVDFPADPVVVDLGDGSTLAISVNDVAVAPGHDAVVTGQIVQPPSNKAPVAVADTYGRHRGNHAPVVTSSVLANDIDAEGDALTAALVTGPSRGTLVFRADGMFTYAPAPNFQSDDAFTYRVFDGHAWSAPATVTIVVEKGRP